MASSTAYKNGSTFYTLYLTADISSQTDTTATISWSSYVTFGDWYYWGIGVTTNGSSVTDACTYSGQTVAENSGSFKVTKTGTSQSKSINASTYSTTVDGYGGVGITTDTSVTLTIPAAGTPNAPNIGTNTRNSDNSNTITWTNNATESKPYTKMIIERSTNGSDFTQIASLDYSSAVNSYVDNTTIPNSYYKYRVRAYNGVNYSRYSEDSNTTYNTPATPTGLRGEYTSSGSVDLTWNDNSVTESNFILESSNDGFMTIGDTHTLPPNTVSFSDTTPPMGTASYRIKTVNGDLSSEYSESISIITLTTPNPPTITSPNGVVDKTKTIKFQWVHKSRDNTPQSSAVLTINNQTFTISGNTNYYDLAVGTMSLPDGPIDFSVKTKGTYTGGSDNGYSEPSYGTFTAFTSPVVNITSPVSTDMGVVTAAPIVVAWDYTDVSGAQNKCNIVIRDNDNKIVFNKSITSTLHTYTIGVEELLPRNNEMYSILVTAQSDTSLSGSSSLRFVTDYNEPAAPYAEHFVDEISASVQLTVFAGNGSEIPTLNIGVFREDSNGSSVIANHINSGDTVVDWVPPVDKQFRYRIVAYAASGVYSSTYKEVIVPSNDNVFINFGGSNYIKIKYGKSFSKKSSPDGIAFNTPSRVIARYGTKTQRTHTITGKKINIDFSGNQVYDLEDLENYHGSVWVREPRKKPFYSKIDVISDSWSNNLVDDIAIDVTEVSYGLD